MNRVCRCSEGEGHLPVAVKGHVSPLLWPGGTSGTNSGTLLL